MKIRFVFIFFLSLLFISCGDIVETTGGIAGTVKDARTATYLANVNVMIMPINETNILGQKSTTTSSDGTFSFDNVIPNTYRVIANKDGYASMEREVYVVAGNKEIVDLILTPSTPELKISNANLDFGTESTMLSFDIENVGEAVLQWEISEDIPWASCLPVSGSVNANEKASVVVNVTRDGFNSGNYSQTFVVSSNGGSCTIHISMSILGIAVSVSPEKLDFGSTLITLPITLKNIGSLAAPYTISSSNVWIRLPKINGSLSPSATEQIVVVVDRADMAEGDYNGNIVVQVEDNQVDIPVKMNIPKKEKPTVYLSSVTDVTFADAVFNGGVVSIGSANVMRHGFCWGTTENPTVEDSKSCNLGDCASPKDFLYKVYSLSATTTYYVRAYAENIEGISYSNCEKFVTRGVPTTPTVETGDVSDIKSSQAVVNGIISGLGNLESVSQYGHVWSTRENPTINDKKTTLGATFSTTSFISTLTGLMPNTTYNVRAYATNEKGTAYGEDVTFTTTYGDVSLTTNEPTDISSKSVKVSGSIEDKGGYSITERGVCWAMQNPPSLSDYSTALSTNNDSFSVIISNLTPETTYYVSIYVKSSTGEVFYGNVVSFKTPTKEVDINKNDYGEENDWSRL